MNLSGLSAISIAPTDKYHDSSIYSIKWNNWHGLYTLDGERICIKNGMVKDSMEYVLESQPTVRIVAYNIKEWGPETFKVYLLDGSILEYGNKEDQNTYAIIGYNENNSPKTLSWYLYKKTDRNGNCINYYYSGGDTNIGIFPKVDKITYGSMARGYFEQIGRIDFQYCKVLASSKYIDGHSINYTWQLQLITVKDQNSNIMEKYKLEYNNQIEGKSLLNSVKRSNSQGESLLPIRFEWASPQYTAYSPTNSTFNDAPWKNEKAAKTGFVLNCAGDIDGDGLTDIIVIYTTGYDTKKEDRKYYWTLAKNKGNNTFDCGPAELYIPRNKSISLICADTDEDGIDEFYIVKPKIKNEQDYIMEFTAYKYDPDKNIWLRTLPNPLKMDLLIGLMLKK
ncbi:MAG: FG-GAP repeat domain-containing protein [Clostridium baratii]